MKINYKEAVEWIRGHLIFIEESSSPFGSLQLFVSDPSFPRIDIIWLSSHCKVFTRAQKHVPFLPQPADKGRHNPEVSFACVQGDRDITKHVLTLFLYIYSLTLIFNFRTTTSKSLTVLKEMQILMRREWNEIWLGDALNRWAPHENVSVTSIFVAWMFMIYIQLIFWRI